MALNDDPQAERTERLLDEYRELPYDERAAFLDGLSAEDRAALLEAELEAAEEVVPDEAEEPDAGG